MACEGCRRRREAIRRAAHTFTESIKSVMNRTTQDKPKQAPIACAGCLTRVTPKGWVNVCRTCNSTSTPSPSPNDAEPNCTYNCLRNKDEPN